MNYRHDLLRWARERSGASYRELEERSGVSRMTLCDTVRGETDPTATTLKATFEALGLDPKYALDFKLKEAQFRRAVVGTAR